MPRQYLLPGYTAVCLWLLILTNVFARFTIIGRFVNFLPLLNMHNSKKHSLGAGQSSRRHLPLPHSPAAQLNPLPAPACFHSSCARLEYIVKPCFGFSWKGQVKWHIKMPLLASWLHFTWRLKKGRLVFFLARSGSYMQSVGERADLNI